MKINKKYSLVKLILLGALNLISSCKEEMSSHNILLQEWQGPYGGVPAFDKMDIKDIQAAVEKGMELNLAESKRLQIQVKRQPLKIQLKKWNVQEQIWVVYLLIMGL